MTRKNVAGQIVHGKFAQVGVVHHPFLVIVRIVNWKLLSNNEWHTFDRGRFLSLL